MEQRKNLQEKIIFTGDIDIDLPDRTKVLELFKHTPAGMIKDGVLKRHNSGVFFTDIPSDALRGVASIDYKEAEQRGYMKIDLLNMSVYELVKDQNHLQELMDREPDWERCWEDREFCKQVVHINSQFGLLTRMKPDTIPRMAMFLSVIRPGKRHLIGESWKTIGETVWQKTDKGYTFRKSHAIAYSQLVAVHINILTD